MPFEFTPVKSSQFQAVAYDAATKKMRIQFKNSVYEYDNVQPEDHAALMASDSKGSHFINTIKKQPEKFPFRKLPSE